MSTILIPSPPPRHALPPGATPAGWYTIHHLSPLNILDPLGTASPLPTTTPCPQSVTLIPLPFLFSSFSFVYVQHMCFTCLQLYYCGCVLFQILQKYKRKLLTVLTIRTVFPNMWIRNGFHITFLTIIWSACVTFLQCPRKTGQKFIK